MSIDFTPDQLVQGFIDAANGKQVAVMVIYGYNDAGRPVIRMTSNSDEKGVAGLMSWLNKTDEAAIEAAARAVHEEMKLVPGPWAILPDMIKEKYRKAVTVGLTAVRTRAGRTLNENGPAIVS